jgi:hypothetical protein
MPAQACEGGTPLPSPEQTAQRIADLATLGRVEYDRQREAVAKELGIRCATLDDAVQAKRKRQDHGADDGGLAADAPTWPHPVDGAALLTEIVATLQRFVIADLPTLRAAALWAVHTYLLDVLTVSPIAHIGAPEKRCGKTVLLSALGKLVHRPLQSVSISAAGLFRMVEKWHPTLLIDEADSFLRDNEPLRGILNSGHTRDSAFVVRCQGDDHEPERFSTWCPKAIAGIGRIADTLEDRSVPLRMRRKLPGESVERLRRAPPAAFDKLRAMIARWAGDNADRIGRTVPAPMPGLHDRAQDNFEPLLAIAEVAGGDWPRLSRDAALALCGQPADAPADELLASIRDVFDTRGVDRVSSSDLVEALAADAEGPWATWNRGRPISPRQVARKLADFQIVPATIRLPNSTTPRGYHLHQFADAWQRYLAAPATPATSATTPQVNAGAGSSAFAIRNTPPDVADEKTRKTKQDAGCGVVADRTPLPARMRL